MTVVWAYLVTAATILFAGVLVATIIVSLLPSHRRKVWIVLGILGTSIASVSFGTGIADQLPNRIIATHVASDTLAEVTRTLPELEQLNEANPLVQYEIASAFQAAYMARDGSNADRAALAGHRMGLVIQRLHIRYMPQLSDQSARRLIAIERQILEEQARADIPVCERGSRARAQQMPARSVPRLAELQRAELRAKLYGLLDQQEGLPSFTSAERRAFEAELKAEAKPLLPVAGQAGSGRCAQRLAFYAALEQQPLPVQGRWLRSRHIFSSNG